MNNSAIVEFTLSTKRKSPLTADKIRVPLFGEGNDDVAFGAVLSLGGIAPILPGETRKVRAQFLNPGQARRELPQGARFTSFEMEGVIVSWLSTADVASE